MHVACEDHGGLAQCVLGFAYDHPVDHSIHDSALALPSSRYGLDFRMYQI